MAENNCNFSEVKELKESKVSVSVNTLSSNNGTMFIETRTQTPQYKSSVQIKEKSTTFEIKSVVQSSRQDQDDGEESADEYDETCSDIVDNCLNNSVDYHPLNNEINHTAKMTPPIHNSLNNGLDINNSKNLDTNYQEKLNLDLSYNNSHEIYEPLIIQKTDNTQLSLSNKPADQWQTRFKVVKIGSAEPFKRGRWSCMDFVDPPSTFQETKQELASDPNVTIEPTNQFPKENSINTNQNLQEILSNQTSLVLESNGTNCTDISSNSTSSSFRPSTPQVPLESQPGFSASTNGSSTPNPQSTVPAVSTASSQVETSDEFAAASTATDNGYSSSSVLSQSSMTLGGFQQPSPNIPNGFLAPLEQSNDSPANPTSSQKSPEVLKDPYPSFQALLEPLSITMVSAEEGESAGAGTGTVALDNKIEQAMDLVKSHLMFAVREEVDVLKDKISELTERIHQLEYENGVLRSHATPEVLRQLASTPPAAS